MSLLQSKKSEGEEEDDDAAPSKDDIQTAEEEGFQSTWASQGWLKENPVGAPTEREVYTLTTGAFGGNAFRILLVRK